MCASRLARNRNSNLTSYVVSYRIVRRRRQGHRRLPPAETREERKLLYDKDIPKRTLSQYKTTRFRWDRFASQYDMDELNKFVNADGSIADHFNNTATQFFKYLDECDDMTYSIVSNAINFLAHELNKQMYIEIGNVAPHGYVSRIQGVLRIKKKYEKDGRAPIVKDGNGAIKFIDLQSKIDTQMPGSKKIMAAHNLLSCAIREMGALASLQMLYEHNASHGAATRSQDLRFDRLGYAFVRIHSAVGEEGFPVLYWFTSGGKSNQGGHLEYYGHLPHANPDLCAIACRGHMLAFRFTSSYGNGEAAPTFTDPESLFLTPTLRGGSRAKVDPDHPSNVPPIPYSTQLQNTKLLFKSIGFTSSAKTHQGRHSALTGLGRCGIEQANKDKFARKDKKSSNTSYDLDVPPAALCERAGHKGPPESFANGWFVHPDHWEDGLEEDLLRLFAPWYHPQAAAVKDALAAHTTHSARQSKCLYTAESALQATRISLAAALCAAAARPLDEKNVLQKDSQPCYARCSHPMFGGEVFRSQEYQKLVSKVRKLQDQYEQRREMKDNDLLTRAGLRQVLREELSAVVPMPQRPSPLPPPPYTGMHAPPPSFPPPTAPTTAAVAATTGTNNAIAATRTGTGTAAKKPKMSHAEAARQNSEKRGCTCYVQNTSLNSIAEIWKEYKHGINGGPSLEWLEETVRYWRSYPQGNMAFCRRSGIYYRIEQLTKTGIAEEDAVAQLQALLDEHESEKNKLDLKGFSEQLRKKHDLKPKPKGNGKKRKRSTEDV